MRLSPLIPQCQTSGTGVGTSYPLTESGSQRGPAPRQPGTPPNWCSTQLFGSPLGRTLVPREGRHPGDRHDGSGAREGGLPHWAKLHLRTRRPRPIGGHRSDGHRPARAYREGQRSFCCRGDPEHHRCCFGNCRAPSSAHEANCKTLRYLPAAPSTPSQAA